jgi:hypothetical protein
MTLQKICDVCGKANLATEIICQRCFSDISKTKPVDPANVHKAGKKVIRKKKSANVSELSVLDQDKTIREVGPLLLALSSGQVITVHHGDTIGRDAVGGRILNQFSAISRHHATFKYLHGKWLVRDDNSTNGTYINGKKISPDTWYELKPNDVLSVSSGCNLTVQG